MKLDSFLQLVYFPFRFCQVDNKPFVKNEKATFSNKPCEKNEKAPCEKRARKRSARERERGVRERKMRVRGVGECERNKRSAGE